MNSYEKALETLTADIRSNLEEGISEGKIEILADALIQRGWTTIDLVTRFPDDYAPGRRVEILDLQQGKWVEGDVSGHVGNTVQVDTERGPRTVGSSRSIRPVY
jgi:hypothetical protein